MSCKSNDYRALPVQEYEERRLVELARALIEHGEEERLAICAPNRDLMDEVIWLLVKLMRLGEGLEARALLRKTHRTKGEAQMVGDLVKLSRTLYAFSARSMFDLVQLRQQMLRRGENLGEPWLALDTNYGDKPVRPRADS